MDELWQRYRTFWSPVLIGLGVFLVGVIVVHILSDNPDTAHDRMDAEMRKLKAMRAPPSKTAMTLQKRGELLRDDVEGPARDDGVRSGGWAARVDQAAGDRKNLVGVAADQALRAAVLRGAPKDASAADLRSRFEGDEVAADKALRRYERLVDQHGESLRSGDPNVAFSRLLSDVWSELRLRANRADVEFAAQAEQLGFGAISSVDRATLPARVLNLALAARLVDVAIREEVDSIEQIDIKAQVDAGDANQFISLWPLEFVVVGEMAGMKRLLDHLTDPSDPVPLETTRLAQARRRGRKSVDGLVQFSVQASSVVVRADVDLQLDAEEDE
ncbi:MAG: hypothetical protein O2894_05480 [Planctomycetota bacterium]|nr:hypothetical protein [Planctomycetota bacterium]